MNYLARRAAHIERAAAIKARKRQRQQRADIHAAMDKAREMCAPKEATAPYRAPDIKEPSHGRDSKGWQILDANDVVVAYGKSRDKARAAAKDANDHGLIYTVPNEKTIDEAMLELGYRRVLGNRTPTHALIDGDLVGFNGATRMTDAGKMGGHHVEDKYARAELYA